jgi:UDP-N-acetylmuramate--alanine ligase
MHAEEQRTINSQALQARRLHFMGIGGQGISAVAQMARQAGWSVSGCDRTASATTRALQAAGIQVQIGHSAHHLEECDALVISPAVTALQPDHPELLAARERHLPLLTWQELLGALTRDHCLLSVCGVHGKGTTTALLALMLVEDGRDPTCEIGAVVPAFGANYRLGSGQLFVNEADEFNHNFWHYHPRLTVVTSIEYEHPEFFANYEAFLQAFEHFIRGMDLSTRWELEPTLILNADSPGCLELDVRLSTWPGRRVLYRVAEKAIDEKQAPTTSITFRGFSYPLFEACDVVLSGETSFCVRLREGASDQQGTALLSGHRLSLQLPGRHNVENALAALAAAHTLGVSDAAIISALEGFSGTRRRFEIRHQGPLPIAGRSRTIMLVDDYAHHPTAIAATLAAARQRYPQHRLIAVYQPHMYSRTKTFFEQFVTAFDEADVALIVDIFPARERDTGLVHARDLAAALAQRPHFRAPGRLALYGGDLQRAATHLRALLEDNDLALIMGAGDVYTLTEDLLSEAKQPLR